MGRLLSTLVCASALTSVVLAIDTLTKHDNANHIFNAIHASMRQWGSSWHHNGMSFFLATVPASTQFYHGTGTPDAITGMEWLAFEPEHALVFAHTWDKSPQDGSPHPPPTPPLSAQEPLLLDGDEPNDKPPLGPPPSRPGQPSPPPPPRDWKPGYLHTYSTLHPLSLLYIDGQSAGKSSLGTLDSQDFLLLNQSSLTLDPNDGERVRATKLCELVHSQWEDKIDGILRMEAGFEVILCDFEKHLTLTDVIRATEEVGKGRGMGSWNWLSAITARYNGIGGERVTIDYEEFITAFRYGLDLFAGQKTNSSLALPRLKNISSSDLDVVRRDVDDLINLRGRREIRGVNWQAKADMIVTRYSNLLLRLLTIENVTALQIQVAGSLRPFINSEDRNVTAELERCTHQFLPYPSSISTTSSLPLAYESLHAVSTQICSTLFSLLPASPSSSPTDGMDASSAHVSLQSLVRYLDWSTFADCPQKCSLEEICLIPIWPMGSKKQRELGHGLCLSSDSTTEGNDYWHDGREGGPGPGRDHGPDHDRESRRIRPGPK